MTVEDADRQHPELHGGADIGVDYYGVLYTSPNRQEQLGIITLQKMREETENVRVLEKQFLKPDGRLFTNID